VIKLRGPARAAIGVPCAAVRKARYTIRNNRAPSMLGRASSPSPLPCAPGKYREICDLVTARKRTRAAKSLISAEPQGKFPNRPNRELIRPDRDLIQSNWEAPAMKRSSLPVAPPSRVTASSAPCPDHGRNAAIDIPSAWAAACRFVS
jgi:hypothetical protein